MCVRVCAREQRCVEVKEFETAPPSPRFLFVFWLFFFFVAAGSLAVRAHTRSSVFVFLCFLCFFLPKMAHQRER